MMIERIIRFSIDARYLILILTALVAAYGWHWALELPIDAVPDITNNQVQINTEAQGFSPEEVEKQITFPIENALKGIAGLESTRSLSRNNFSQVTVVFEDHVNIYFARQQILEKLGEAREFLPPEIDPIMGPVSTGLGEVVMWSVEYDPNAPLSTPGKQKDGSYITPSKETLTGDAIAGYLREVEDWIVAPQLRGVKGLAEVDAIGGFVKEYHIHPNFMKLQAHGLGLKDLEEALVHSNLSVGAGIIESHGEAFLVKGEGRLSNPDHLLDIVVGTKGTAPIHLRDIAEVSIGHELRSGSATKEGKEVVIGTAMMRVGSNSRTVAHDVVERLDSISKSLPPGIQIKILLDRTTLVDSTVHTVLKNLAEGAGLVILVLFLTLNNFMAAGIVALVIPLSMLMAGIGMSLIGISGNLMSLGAIDFGLIVDGAVIITENVLRHLMQKSKNFKESFTLQEKLDEIKVSAVEVIKPSVFGQLIIMAVYLPILTLQGIEGKMFRPMASVVLLALVSAFVLSLTYVPAALALFLRPKK